VKAGVLRFDVRGWPARNCFYEGEVMKIIAGGQAAESAKGPPILNASPGPARLSLNAQRILAQLAMAAFAAEHLLAPRTRLNPFDPLAQLNA